jgi:cytochrome c-type biogenesis protein CcmH
MLKRALLALAIVAMAATSTVAVQPDEIMSDAAKEERARDLSRELRCMVCQNQSIDDSEAPLARDLRKPRLNSHTWLLWFLTPLALALGGTALWMQGRRRARSDAEQDAASSSLTPEEEARIDRLITAKQVAEK